MCFIGVVSKKRMYKYNRISKRSAPIHSELIVSSFIQIPSASGGGNGANPISVRLTDLEEMPSDSRIRRQGQTPARLSAKHQQFREDAVPTLRPTWSISGKLHMMDIHRTFWVGLQR